VAVVEFVAHRPGQLGDAAHDPQQKAHAAVGPRRAEQRIVAAVVHQGEAAGQEEHLQSQHRDQQPGLTIQRNQGQPPEQAVGHKGIDQLPETPAIGGCDEGPKLKITTAHRADWGSQRSDRW
jgi:hypothetical protein